MPCAVVSCACTFFASLLKIPQNHVTRRAGLVMRIAHVVGILTREGQNYFIIPDDKRMGLRYYLTGAEKPDRLGSELGSKVIAHIVSYPSKKKTPVAPVF